MLPSTWALMLICVFARDTYAIVPSGRAGAAGVLIGNKIFVHGGFTGVRGGVAYGYATNEMIILPVDTTFPLSAPAYESDSPLITSGSPNVLGGVSFFGGYNNSGFNLFGGRHDNLMTGAESESSSLFMFNTTSYNWTSITTIPASWPEARDSFSAVSNVKTGDGFIFGGEYNINGSNSYLFNTTWRLQYGNIWTEIGPRVSDGGRQGHGAAILSDGRMVILGGSYESTADIPFTTVLIFDPDSQQYIWLNATLSGSDPVPRVGFSMVATHDDKIIIFGGDSGSNGYCNDLAVLDMNQTNLAWTVPPTSGVAPPGRNAHNGLMVGSQMFIMFGQTGSDSVDNGVFVLDTNTWSWQTTYTPQNLEYTSTALQPQAGSDNSSIPTNSSDSHSGSNISSTAPSGAIIGGSVGAAVVVLLIAACFLIRRHKRKREMEQTTVYQTSEREPHSEFLPNNMYTSIPLKDQRQSLTTHTSSRDSSTVVNSLGDTASNRLSIISQKPNVSIHALYQKPDEED